MKMKVSKIFLILQYHVNALDKRNRYKTFPQFVEIFNLKYVKHIGTD